MEAAEHQVVTFFVAALYSREQTLKIYIENRKKKNGQESCVQGTMTRHLNTILGFLYKHFKNQSKCHYKLFGVFLVLGFGSN